MRNKKGLRDDFISKKIEKEARQSLDEFFDNRKIFNKEDKAFILKDNLFIKKIKEIRKKFKIPVLRKKDDVEFINHIYGFDDCVVDHSKFLYSLDKTERKEFDESIWEIIFLYKLPNTFYDWIEEFILYRLKPDFSIDYNFDLLFYIENFEEIAKNLPITSKEKSFVKRQFRLRYKIKDGRIPKRCSKEYKKICKVLDSAKNYRRRRKTDINEINDFIFKMKKESKTYDVMVSENDYLGTEGIKESEIRYNKENAKWRKRVQRLNKRKPKK